MKSGDNHETSLVWAKAVVVKTWRTRNLRLARIAAPPDLSSARIAALERKEDE